MVKVAVLGYGTVGSGVVEIIEENKKLLNKRSGNEIEVKYILDLREFPGDPHESKVIHDFDVIVNDPEVNVVCETMGGTGAAYKFTKACLEAGKTVCTSNKAMVAAYGPEMLRIAQEKNCSYLFEASVGGGIPIIRPLTECLTADRVEGIVGILNGTTNFMLTKMDKEGADYDVVLKEAQALGYAEQDPTADVGGFDTCRKIAILSSLMTGKNVDFEKILTEGITEITSADFEYAKATGKSIKLLAMSKVVGEKLEALVAPMMLGSENPLALVNGVFNGILVTGNMVGDVMFYGQGAGKLATASAVVADIVEAAKNVGKNIPCFWEDTAVSFTDVAIAERSFYVRAKKNAKEALLKLLPDGEVVELASRPDEFAYFTKAMAEEKVFAAVDQIKDDVLGRIRLA